MYYLRDGAYKRVAHVGAGAVFSLAIGAVLYHMPDAMDRMGSVRGIIV